MKHALCFAALLAVSATCRAADGVVPGDLPRPDAKAPATDQPVKVYILSGQSNSVGFGRVEGGDPPYASLFLSADPSVVPCRMPVGSSALLPHRVYTAAEGDTAGAIAKVFRGGYDAAADYAKLDPVQRTTIALGTVALELPKVDGPHTVVVEGFIEVPMSGPHEVRAGFGDSTHALVVMDGKEVYRKPVGGTAALTRIELESGRRYPVTITYFQGGSAAFWMERVNLEPRGSLRYYVGQGKYGWMVDEQGQWLARHDVTLNDAYLGKGASKPLSATWRGSSFGPELGFGWVLGTFHDEPVLLIKSDIGNRSLAWDCLPPGSERYVVDGTVYAGYKDTQGSWPVAQGEPLPSDWYAGKQYDEYVAAVHRELAGFNEKYPQWKDQGYEVAGFVWWQGHKDQNPVHAARYEQNLVRLIEALRKEFNAPRAKFVVSTGCGNPGRTGFGLQIAEAQLAVDGRTGKYPQFAGNVRSIDNRDFWRSIGESPKGQDFHYNHNAETYLLTGDALGRAMVELEGGTVQWRPTPPRPTGEPKPWPRNPTLAQAVEMVYSDAFISAWSQDEAEPTDEQRAQMIPALRPIILDKLVHQLTADAANVPSYLRRGLPVTTILSNEAPQKPSAVLTSQLDQLIALYGAAGVEEYNWKPFGPEMRTATWDYFSFDPPEQQDKAQGGRNRKVTLPAGMEGWFAVGFDAKKAGWKSGAAPFGQRHGELAALRGKCNNPHCRCDTVPATLWEHEVLLMRQTFDIPTLDPQRRYRLVVGGGSHAWSGEGFNLYVNGKPFAQANEGYYKGEGGNRGGYVFNNFLPDFQGGKVTIAVQGFLRFTHHRGKEAPPSGHLSVWLEEVQLPPTLSHVPPAAAQ